MKKFLLALMLLSLAIPPLAGAGGRHKENPRTGEVKSYIKKDGTRVKSHKRTKPNKDKGDNFSSKGNVNPDTGKEGNVDPNR